MGTDGKYRIFAEAVDRAILKCNPIKNLPPKTYENWSTMILRFNPEGMMVGEWKKNYFLYFLFIQY